MSQATTTTQSPQQQQQTTLPTTVSTTLVTPVTYTTPSPAVATTTQQQKVFGEVDSDKSSDKENNKGEEVSHSSNNCKFKKYFFIYFQCSLESFSLIGSFKRNLWTALTCSLEVCISIGWIHKASDLVGI